MYNCTRSRGSTGAMQPVHFAGLTLLKQKHKLVSGLFDEDTKSLSADAEVCPVYRRGIKEQLARHSITKQQVAKDREMDGKMPLSRGQKRVQVYILQFDLTR